jgi:hypothetical protein
MHFAKIHPNTNEIIKNDAKLMMISEINIEKCKKKI